MRNQVIDQIFEISGNKDAFDMLEIFFSNISRHELAQNIIQCGILPEAFAHDSSEEKLWAKYSDIVLAKALSYLDIPTEVLRARGNSADVFGKNTKYPIVGDAKTFRLSRTAKNQKDFKIKDYNFVFIDHLPNAGNGILSQLYSYKIKKDIRYNTTIYSPRSSLISFNKENPNKFIELAKKSKEVGISKDKIMKDVYHRLNNNQTKVNY